VSVLPVEARHIEAWSQTKAAEGLLPRLVRRLILAMDWTARVDMPGGEGTRRHGADGRVETSRAVQFVPEGHSIWELSVESTEKKLNDDYDKRVKTALDEGPAGTITYVAVSARSIPDARKKKWAETGKKAGVWRDVLVLDASNLAQWLHDTPAVARWFAEEANLNLPGTESVSLDEYAEAWTGRTQPPFPAQALLAGAARERAAHALRERLRDESAERIYVAGDTSEDALDFITGALTLDDDPESAERWKASTLIAKSRRELARLVREPVQSKLVLIPRDLETDDPVFLPDPLRKIVVPVDRAACTSGMPIVVPPPEAPDLVAALVSRGFETDEAERNVAESGARLEALRRRYGAVGRIPEWSQLASLPVLFSFIVAESWTSADEAWLADLAGVELRELRSAWATLESHTDSPIVRSGVHSRNRVWGRHSEAWGWLAPRLTASMLDRFESAALQVLTSVPPTGGPYSADPSEYEVGAHSSVLMAGIARSLARLTRWGDRLDNESARAGARELVSRVVNESLGVSLHHWKALGPCLRTLAEAAPEDFLRRLRVSLDHEGGVHHLLDHDGSQSNLLWALDMLGWRARLLPDVTARLASLADYDRKVAADSKRLANRPLSSLAHLVAPTLAQTEAAWPDRREALRALRHNHPDLVYELLLGHVPQPVGGFVMASPRPRFVAWKLPTRDELFRRSLAEAEQAISDSMDDLVEQAGVDLGRWERLIDRVRVARVDVQLRVLDALEQRCGEMQAADGRLRIAVRHWLHTGATSRHSERRRAVEARLQALYDSLLPSDVVDRNAWLFASLRPDLPDPPASFDQQMAEAERRRVAFVETIWASEDRDDLLSRLAASAGSTSAWRLGIAMASSAHATEAETLLLRPQADPWLRETAHVFVARRTEDAGREWLVGLLRAWVADGRFDDAFEVVTRLPSTVATWTVIDSLGDAVRSRYWKAFRAFPAEQSEEAILRAIRSCLDAGNPRGAAVSVWAVGGQVSATIAAEVLRALVAVPDLPSNASEITHPVEELFARLVELGGVTDEEGAELELALRPLFGPFHGPGTFNERVFSKDPHRWVDMVRRAFVDPPSDAATGSERSDTLANLLYDWRGFPADDLPPGDERDSLVIRWVREVLTQTEPRIRSIVLHLLGAVLQRVTVGPDDAWPARPVRRLIEDESALERPLAESLRIARFNARGMTSRETAEGGYQERTLSAGYRFDAEAMRSEYPKTADMLLDLADDYGRDARREDEWAQTVARAEGLAYDPVETSLRKLRGIDAAFALYRVLHPTVDVPAAAARLGVEPGTLVDSRARLAAARLADTDDAIDVQRLLELLRGDLRAAFPPIEQSTAPGELVRGVRTGIEAIPRLQGKLVGESEPRVWRSDFGDAFGVSVMPLCPNAAKSRAEDVRFFEALALVDALRFGVARERNLARDELRKLLSTDGLVAQVAQ
jgi:hypothetical protein